MPIEILTGQQNEATPVLWRSVKQESANSGEEAKVQSAHRLEQARREGFASGVAAAQQQADQSILPGMQKLADSIAQVARIRDTVREQSTDDLVRLALAIASRVMHRDVALDSTVLAGLLRAGFSKLRSQEISVARIHPGLEPVLRRCLERGGIPTNLYLLTDAKIKPGKLVFETDSAADSSASNLPANIDLSEIERGFTDRLPN
ncbi:MAG TPA: FliH/SctL family protein [Bryobacteraceae bacterium]|nr:FliH/SctL family protein [Bryobacteraceae bacterium]